MKDKIINLPILVVSNDSYSDIWDPFFKIFRQRWSDCPFQVYLGTNLIDYDAPDWLKVIKSGKDISWASSLLGMLNSLDTEYVLIMLEDFFLTSNVDTGEISYLAELAQKEELGCLRLFSLLPPPKKLDGYNNIGWFAPDDDYRITLQAGIWKIEFLKKLLLPGFNPWEFEIIGNLLNKNISDKVWGVIKPVLVYEQVVEKGKWKPIGLEICRAAGCEVNLEARQVFDQEELDKHIKAGESDSQASQLYFLKRNAIDKFRRGNQKRGIRFILRYLSIKPFDLQIYGIICCSIGGRRAMDMLEYLSLRYKLLKIKVRYNWKKMLNNIQP